MTTAERQTVSGPVGVGPAAIGLLITGAPTLVQMSDLPSRSPWTPPTVGVPAFILVSGFMYLGVRIRDEA